MDYKHKNLAEGRWSQMPFSEQMANIGSEVGRALNWQAKHNAGHSLKAFERALELLDLTIENVATMPRIRELTRLREALADYFLSTNQFISTEASWRKYFYNFAFLTRKHS